MYQTMSATINQMAAMNDTAIVMGQSFDTAQIDDLFYLPPEAFDNPEFQRGLDDVLIARRQIRPLFHHPRRRPDDPGRDRACRCGANGRAGGPEDVLPVGRQSLSWRYRRDL